MPSRIPVSTVPCVVPFVNCCQVLIPGSTHHLPIDDLWVGVFLPSRGDVLTPLPEPWIYCVHPDGDITLSFFMPATGLILVHAGRPEPDTTGYAQPNATCSRCEDTGCIA